MNGAQFAAYIEGCTDPDDYVYRLPENIKNDDTVKIGKTAGLIVHPNPTTDLVNISLTGGLLKTVQLYTLDGRLVGVYNNVQDSHYQINLDQYPVGTYMISTLDMSGNKTVARVVKR
ncbi:MAG TPA: T9SS type A sorting domain-containing protein [Flavobacterium sp.]|jgi:hypothetical protein